MDKPIPTADTRCHIVLTTLPSRDAARAIARTLVEERRAACVQILDGLQSIYRWEGRIDESAECQLVAKAPAASGPALADRLRALHPYDVPEILTLEAAAADSYAAWLLEETRAR
jgi:periplasmic divalent cation tolerance protein